MEQNQNQIIFVICYGLIGAGKSSLFHLIEEIINSEKKFKSKFETLYISSDKIKAQKISDYRVTHNCSFQKAHDKINMKSKSSFNNEVLNGVENLKSEEKTKLILVDKLFFPDSLNEFYQ